MCDSQELKTSQIAIQRNTTQQETKMFIALNNSMKKTQNNYAELKKTKRVYGV